MTKYTDEDLIVNEKLREELMSKVDVLDTVKEIILLPNTELMTTRMVAEYFEVEFTTIEKSIQRNREELAQNGFKRLSYRELKEMIGDEDKFNSLRISRQGSNVLSLRSVMLIATLLSDSVVAEKVRHKMSLSENLTIREMLAKNNSRVKWKQREIHKALSKSFESIFSVESESTI